MAQALYTFGRKASHAALTKLLAEAQSRGLVAEEEPSEMATQFFALLWGDMLMQQQLRLADAPTPKQIERRAVNATQTLLRLHPGSTEKS